MRVAQGKVSVLTGNLFLVSWMVGEDFLAQGGAVDVYIDLRGGYALVP